MFRCNRGRDRRILPLRLRPLITVILYIRRVYRLWPGKIDSIITRIVLFEKDNLETVTKPL